MGECKVRCAPRDVRLAIKRRTYYTISKNLLLCLRPFINSGRTTPLWLLSVPNSNSYLRSYSSSVLADSILCLNKDLLKRPSNPCSTTDQVNNTYWFGTLISCKRDVYSLSFAQTHCPTGQVLADINDAQLYSKISNEIASSLG